MGRERATNALLLCVDTERENLVAEATVGYRKPPQHARFKRGRSGNPSGRRKGAPNLATVLQNALSDTIVVVEHGEEKTISKMEAAVKRLVDKAIAGDMSAFRVLSDLTRILDDSANRASSADLEGSDQKLLASLVSRFAAPE
jgi:Family of unknown function (DUF5681)